MSSPVIVLWSAPRSRSTAFFRSMLERGDLLALHEPLEGLAYIGPIEVGARTFTSPESLVWWLLAGDAKQPVFLKETVNPRVLEMVHAQPSFLRTAHHAFLIRDPLEIAASWWALEGDMRILDTGVEALYELFIAVGSAGGSPPAVIDSDDLVTQPASTMHTFCDAVGLPFVDGALQWESGVPAAWARTARWHVEASASTGFVAPSSPDRHGLESHDEVRRFDARHRPFYDALRAFRLVIDVPPST
ncbi:MAG: sulfotransferase family protein [Actinomycetota bacterium]